MYLVKFHLCNFDATWLLFSFISFYINNKTWSGPVVYSCVEWHRYNKATKQILNTVYVSRLINWTFMRRISFKLQSQVVSDLLKWLKNKMRITTSFKCAVLGLWSLILPQVKEEFPRNSNHSMTHAAQACFIFLCGSYFHVM